jgi:hypothetical protein
LLLYSSKPSLGVYQLAGHFTSSTQANKFSGTIITAPSTSFSGVVAGEEWKTSARGVFARTSFTLFYCIVLLYFIYFTCIILYQKPKKIESLVVVFTCLL